MQTVLTKYWLIVHVGLLWFVSWFGLTPSSGFSQRPLFWLSLLLLEALVLLPAVQKGETLSDARGRIGRALVRDPFTYIGLAVLVMAAVRWLNGGRTLVYLSDADVWQFSAPAFSWLASSVEKPAAFANLAVQTACVAACLVLRLGASRVGRRYLLQAAAMLSGCVAFWFVWRACAHVQPYEAWAREPAACNPGSFFGFWLVVGMGAYVDALSRRQAATVWMFALAFVGNLLGVLFFASALAALVYVAVAALLVVYWMLVLGHARAKSLQVRLFLASALVAAATFASLAYAFPSNPVSARAKAAMDWDARWKEFTADREIRSAAGLKIWKGQPWVGVGPGGFHHYVGTVVDGKAWALIKRDQAWARNDGLQFLCERGVLGVGLLAALVAALAVPVCYRLRLLSQGGSQGDYESQWLLLRMSPVALTGILAALLVFAESWVASPLQSSAMWISWILLQAALPAFMPIRAAGAA
jgi:hypothetical protein